MFPKLLMSVVLVCILSGCATTQKPSSNSHLQLRMEQVETRMDEQERDISELKIAVNEVADNVAKLSGNVGASAGRSSTRASSASIKASQEGDSQKIIRVPVTPQEVQTALKNAGYYDGAIDGKLGSGSQRGIKTFQKDHDLESDGIIGQKTWTELKNYLE